MPILLFIFLDKSSLCFQVNDKKKEKNDCCGTYNYISDKDPKTTTTTDVWKQKYGNHLIFNTGSDLGWRIIKNPGIRELGILTDENFLFKSKTPHQYTPSLDVVYKRRKTKITFIISF